MARRGLVGFLVLGVVAGVGMGFAATALAGARRSETAYTRLREATLAPDAYFDSSDVDAAGIRRAKAVDGVLGAARFTYTPVAPVQSVSYAGAFVGLDADFLSRVYRPVLVRGRMPTPGSIDEVLINEVMARRARLRPGQSVQLRSGFEERKVALGGATVVGVIRGTFDVGPNAGNASMLLSHEFFRAHRDQMVLAPQPTGLVRLASDHADLAPLRRALRASTGHDIDVSSADGEGQSIDRALAVQTIGLAVLGIVAFIATIAAAVQALSRLFDRALADLPVLVAIGLQPRQRLVLGALLAAPVALVGCGVAAFGAILASPLIPTGFAREVDPVSGVQVDLTVLTLVCVIGIAVLVSMGVALAWRHRAGRSPAHAGHETRLARKLPLGPRLGFQAALAPTRAPAGAASRSALIAGALGVTAVVAVGTFGASLTELLHDRALYGWTFDASISGPEGGSRVLRPALAGIARDPAVRQVGFLSVVEVSIRGQAVEAYAFDRDGLALHPAMRTGRPPAADDEVVLGADAMNTLGTAIGDHVVVSGPRSRARLRVVGSATYPEIGNNSDLAGGVSLTRRTATRIGAAEHAGVALIRLQPGQGIRALQKYRDAGELVAPFRPPRVRNLDRVGSLPRVLATFVAVLGLLAVGHGLWRSTRARRRDFAILATIGFRPRDLRAIVGWQATCIASIAIALGVPGGLLIARASWSAVADSTGVVDQLVTPVLAIVVVAAATVGLANLVGVASARWVSRTHPTVVLRDQ